MIALHRKLLQQQLDQTRNIGERQELLKVLWRLERLAEAEAARQREEER